MGNFDWKWWRIAWSTRIDPYRLYGVDLDGGWVRVCGPLWWLRHPRHHA